MAGFGLPNFGQLTEAFRKAQQIQQDAQKLQDELDAMELEGSSSDGLASVWVSGNQQPLRVRVAPELVAAGSEATEVAVLEALKAAYERSTATMKERMEELAKSFYYRFGHRNPQPEAFEVFNNRDRHPEWMKQAEPVVRRVAEVWASVGLPFPLDEVMEAF
jgi:DNA-binding YbaB/EbfC family protein